MPLLYLIGIVLVLSSAFPLVKGEAWWVRVFDFPRLQILFICLLFLAIFPIAKPVLTAFDITFLSLIGFSCLLHLKGIAPYSPLLKKQVQSAPRPLNGPTIKFMTANVLMENRRSKELVEIVNRKDPDVLLLVEVNQWWVDQMNPLKEKYPFQIIHPQDNTYGMALFSKKELINPKVEFLVKENIPSIHATIKISTNVNFQGFFIHPQPPAPTHAESSLPRDVELLLVGKKAKRIQEPVIVAGDLNDVAWSKTTKLFQKESGLLDPRVGRGLFSTYHAKIPLVKWPLDHFFQSKEFKVVSIERLPSFGSDHFPMFLELALEENNQQSNGLDLDNSDKGEIKRKLRKENNI